MKGGKMRICRALPSKKRFCALCRTALSCLPLFFKERLPCGILRNFSRQHPRPHPEHIPIHPAPDSALQPAFRCVPVPDAHKEHCRKNGANPVLPHVRQAYKNTLSPEDPLPCRVSAETSTAGSVQLHICPENIMADSLSSRQLLSRCFLCCSAYRRNLQRLKELY